MEVETIGKFPIESFSGKNRFLSNFYMSNITVKGRVYPSVEHAFQAQKSMDEEVRKTIANLPYPAQAKRIGRTVELRPDWEYIKCDVMYQLLQLKFEQGTALAEMLVRTHPAALIEGNTWGDTYWGVCRGRGNNMLGKLLMKVRSELIENDH